MSYSHLNQPLIVANIDKLVKYALSKKPSIKKVRGELNDLYEPFMNIYEPFMKGSNDGLCYAKTINAFIGSTESIVGDSYPDEVVWDHDKTKRFIRTLSSYEKDIKDQTRVWRYNEGQNKNNLDSLIRDLTNQYSKLLFVFVDLKYLLKTSHLVTIYDFYRHINKFLELISNRKTCFKHLQGYAWALEQGGKEGGLHCHLLLMYDGSERQKDYYLGQQVGEKWQAITGGLGTYYNWNTSSTKREFEEKGLLGIGMIHRDNPIQVENAVRVGCYLTKIDKSEQQLKLRLPGMNTFGRGQFNVPWRRNKKR